MLVITFAYTIQARTTEDVKTEETQDINKIEVKNPLTITTDFLEKLYKEDLPFDNNIMRTVKRMMAQENDTPYVLYGKKGSSPDGPDGQVGWYVGFVENGDDSYVFVTNIDDTGLNAKDITLDILNKHFKQ